MRVITVTPHPVVVVVGDGALTLPPSGLVARCAVERRPIGTIVVGGYAVPTYETRLGELDGLPEPEEGTIFAVSSLAAQAAWAAGRRDMFVPDDRVRDEVGRVAGARALARGV